MSKAHQLGTLQRLSDYQRVTINSAALRFTLGLTIELCGAIVFPELRFVLGNKVCKSYIEISE